MSAFRDAQFQVRYVGRRYAKTQWIARLEAISFSDVADLGDIGFHKLQTIFLDPAIPMLQLFLYAPRSRPNPLQFEVEDRPWVVNDIMMQDHTFCLVTFLEMN